MCIRDRREAARLEQVINASVMQQQEINGLLKNITLGLAAVWPDYNIQYQEIADLNNSQLNSPVLKGNVAPELIAQALEKLIANAVDFSSPQGAIMVTIGARITTQKNELFISVSNLGKLLPKGKEKQLIENMVSVRLENQSNAAHLGLGLHMVQLIAQFHGGEVEIRNREDKLGVIAGFSIKID